MAKKNSVPRLGVGGSHVGAPDAQNRAWVREHHMGPANGSAVAKPVKGTGKSYGPGEWAALGIAGGITGIVGAAAVSGIRQGMGNGASKFNKTK